MGAFYEVIPQSMIEWIRQQKLFWVATAPLSAAGHVNVSPKGGQYFGVTDNKTFWYVGMAWLNLMIVSIDVLIGVGIWISPAAATRPSAICLSQTTAG